MHTVQYTTVFSSFDTKAPKQYFNESPFGKKAVKRPLIPNTISSSGNVASRRHFSLASINEVLSERVADTSSGTSAVVRDALKEFRAIHYWMTLCGFSLV